MIIIYIVYYFQKGNPNAGWSIATELLLAIHMMFVNILLINLLIAMFRYVDMLSFFGCVLIINLLK